MYDAIIEWAIPLSAALVGVIIGGLLMFWLSRKELASIAESRPAAPNTEPHFVDEDERTALRSVVGEMRLNALMVEETSVIWSWAPFERRAIDNAQWLFPGMPPVVAEAVARANRKVTEYNSIAEFVNTQDQQVHEVAQEARTALVIAAQRLEEYLTDVQMERGRRGLRIPRPGGGTKQQESGSHARDYSAT